MEAFNVLNMSLEMESYCLFYVDYLILWFLIMKMSINE